jgi:hypothetical protein
VDRGPVEGKDRRDDAVGLVGHAGLDGPLVEDLAVDGLDDSRVVVEARMARDDVDAQRVALRFADLSRAQFAQFVGVLSNPSGDLAHHGATLLGGHVAPHVVVGPSRIEHGPVDDLVGSGDHARQRSSVRRLEDFEGLGARHIDELAADERPPQRPVVQQGVARA